MQKKKFSGKFFKKILFLFSFLSTIFITFFIFNYFKVKKIIIVDKKDNFSLIGLSLIKNQSIFTLDEEKLSHYLVKNNPQIETITVKKNLPNTIIIYPYLSTIAAQLKTSSGFFLLSNKGRIISKKKAQTVYLPLINFYQQLNFYQYQTGNYLTYKEILIGLNFLEKLKSLGFNDINIVDIKSYDVIVFNNESTEILIAAGKNKNQLFYELETIVKRNKINSRNFKKIDLRFNKPIITLYE